MSDKTLKRTLSRWDLLAIGIGAVIGWSWIIYAGIWSSAGGTVGGLIGFAIAGVLCTFVGLAYAELTSAFPRAGGDVVFAYEGIGETAGIITAWAMILLWVGLVMIETQMFPVIMEGLGIPIPKWGAMYVVAGQQVYLSYILISLIGNAFFAFANFKGAKLSGTIQTAAVLILLVAAVFFMAGGLTLGNPTNILPYFTDNKGIITIMLMLPAFLAGFNAIPQASEEGAVSPNVLGKLVVFTVWGSVLFYLLIVIGLAFAAPAAVRSGEGLVVAQAVDLIFNGNPIARTFVVFASLLGMLTTWNASYIAGSRLLYGLGRACIIPTVMSRINEKYRTPSVAIFTLFIISTLFTFFGTSRIIYVGIVDVFSLFLVVAWFLVSVSFLRLRTTRPDLERPYKVGAGKLVGWIAVLFSFAYFLIYTPLGPAGLPTHEWIATGLIVLAMVIVYFFWNRGPGAMDYEERKKLLGEDS